MAAITKNLITKLESLPQDVLKQVEDFVDYMRLKSSAAKNLHNKDSDKKKSIYGVAEGKITYNGDFNEPLEDLKDYM